MKLLYYLGIFKRIFRMPVFQVMGKLTFGAYLVHANILRISIGQLHRLIYTNSFEVVGPLRLFSQQEKLLSIFHFHYQIQLSISILVLSYIFSFLLYMAVEMPFAIICKHMLVDQNRSKKSIFDTTKVDATLLDNIKDIDKKTNELQGTEKKKERRIKRKRNWKW